MHAVFLVSKVDTTSEAIRSMTNIVGRAGDAQELASIDAVYGSGDARRSPDRPLLIGSVKSNMGHCEGGSGLAGKQCPVLPVLPFHVL